MLRDDSICGRCKSEKVQDCYHCPYCGVLNCGEHCYKEEDGIHLIDVTTGDCTSCKQNIIEPAKWAQTGS